MSLKLPSPIDSAEAIAFFRLQVIGSLVGRDFDHGELRAEIRAVAAKHWRPPAGVLSRTYSVPTIERWYYGFQAGGIEALFPKRRSDCGRGRALTDAQKELLLDIRRDHPSVGAPTIIDTLVRAGRLDAGQLAPATLNRLYARNGLRRRHRNAVEYRSRRRWQAEAPGMLWHSDVCHGPDLVTETGERAPVRIHAILDDASRYVVSLEVHGREREVEMLGMFGRAIQRVGAPKKLYLDNGATYSGAALLAVCGRLSVALVHAKPYDPEARGKMERFWRTMREQCLDHLGGMASLHDIRVRLHAWLDQRYHGSAHAGLLGRDPRTVWNETNVCERVEEAKFLHAFSTRDRRRVRKDSTLDLNGVVYQIDASFLAGNYVDLVRYLPPVGPEHPPHAIAEERKWALHPVDPVANSKIKRARISIEAAPTSANTTDFDVGDALLRAAISKTNPDKDNA